MSLPQFWWTDTKTWKTILYRGEEVHFVDLCKVFQETGAKLMQIWEEGILMGQDIRVKYDKIADDLINKDVGYSFLSGAKNPQLTGQDHLEQECTASMVEKLCRASEPIAVASTDAQQCSKSWYGADSHDILQHSDLAHL
ncbi:hypothetical protein EDD17DRAFT_1513402 [Pisolithus thermaeus]|nr:hypothetical protein EV401DRAFT_1890451 [Pisolithus croceorrhizus]KAI6151402.1 hypothetical protein EDD17DRAFT_1513402 [Pisolithus thermaeus]